MTIISVIAIVHYDGGRYVAGVPEIGNVRSHRAFRPPSADRPIPRTVGRNDRPCGPSAGARRSGRICRPLGQSRGRRAVPALWRAVAPGGDLEGAFALAAAGSGVRQHLYPVPDPRRRHGLPGARASAGRHRCGASLPLPAALNRSVLDRLHLDRQGERSSSALQRLAIQSYRRRPDAASRLTTSSGRQRRLLAQGRRRHRNPDFSFPSLSVRRCGRGSALGSIGIRC